MNFYKVCFRGRLNGALGISYGHTKRLWAESTESARLRLYESHECILGATYEVMLTTGTVISGTLKTSELYPAFRQAIKVLDVDKECTDWPEITDHRLYESGGVNDFDMPDMIADLDSMAPKGYYFGTLDGDGADFGFWPISDEEGDL